MALRDKALSLRLSMQAAEAPAPDGQKGAVMLHMAGVGRLCLSPLSPSVCVLSGTCIYLQLLNDG